MEPVPLPGALLPGFGSHVLLVEKAGLLEEPVVFRGVVSGVDPEKAPAVVLLILLQFSHPGRLATQQLLPPVVRMGKCTLKDSFNKV